MISKAEQPFGAGPNGTSATAAAAKTTGRRALAIMIRGKSGSDGRCEVEAIAKLYWVLTTAAINIGKSVADILSD